VWRVGGSLKNLCDACDVREKAVGLQIDATDAPHRAPMRESARPTTLRTHR
jgi:hypothetical protein